MTESKAATVESCPHAVNCPLFPTFKLNSLLNVWKLSYCDGAYATCARYRLSMEGKHVPLTMLPNGKQLTLPTKP